MEVVTKQQKLIPSQPRRPGRLKSRCGRGHPLPEATFPASPGLLYLLETLGIPWLAATGH